MVDRSSILVGLADRTARQRAADTADKLAAERMAERDKYLKGLEAACRGSSASPRAAVRALLALRDVLKQHGRLDLVRRKAADVAALGGRWSGLPGHEGAFSSSLLADGLDPKAKAAGLTSDLDRFCKQLVEVDSTQAGYGLRHFYFATWKVVEVVCRAISASDEDWTRWENPPPKPAPQPAPPTAAADVEPPAAAPAAIGPAKKRGGRPATRDPYRKFMAEEYAKAAGSTSPPPSDEQLVSLARQKFSTRIKSEEIPYPSVQLFKDLRAEARRKGANVPPDTRRSRKPGVSQPNSGKPTLDPFSSTPTTS